MAALGSSIASEVGLRVLLSPIGSNVIVRTACCSVGIVLPVYSTFKAIERRNEAEQQKMLIYWAAFGSFCIVETFTDKLLYWFPMYNHVKFAFLVWLQLPSLDGAKHLYYTFLRPFLLNHQEKCDRILGVLYTDLIKFVSSHQNEIHCVKTFFYWILGNGGNNGSEAPNHQREDLLIEDRNHESESDDS